MGHYGSNSKFTDMELKKIQYKFKRNPSIGVAADGPTRSETGGQT